MLDETGARAVAVRLEFMLPGLRTDPNVFDLADMDVLGLAVLLEIFRLERLGLLGTRTDRELMLLGLRLAMLELAGARLTLEGALALGAGAGAGLGACRLDELLLPPPALFRSFFALDTGAQSRIKTEMSTRIPLLIHQTQSRLTSCRYSIANMICLLSANGPRQDLYSTLTIKGANLKPGNEKFWSRRNFPVNPLSCHASAGKFQRCRSGTGLPDIHIRRYPWENREKGEKCTSFRQTLQSMAGFERY